MHLRTTVRSLVPGWVRRALRSRASATYAWLRLTQGKRLMQDDGFTTSDRHPRLFGFVRDTLGEGGDLLSFGCSTGDEVLSLGRWFPSARVLGLDIHPGHIAVCRRRLAHQADPRLSCAVAADTSRLSKGSQDAIFCLSVLRRGDLGSLAGDSCAMWLRFEAFERHVAEFARVLRPGGLLILRHSNFRLRDTAIAAAFEPVLTLDASPDSATPLFGPDNRRLADQAYGEVVFRRL